MAHLYGSLRLPPTGTYYPDFDESTSGGSGAAATNLTNMGDDRTKTFFADDGSEHAVIYMIVVGASSGQVQLVGSSGTVYWQSAVTGNSPYVLDFGDEGMRIPEGWTVNVPTLTWLTIVYDKVSA